MEEQCFKHTNLLSAFIAILYTLASNVATKGTLHDTPQPYFHVGWAHKWTRKLIVSL
jgi:hypothetical protein